MGQNDTTIQPMTSGPETSIIGVPFLQSIIYIYILTANTTRVFFGLLALVFVLLHKF